MVRTSERNFYIVLALKHFLFELAPSPNMASLHSQVELNKSIFYIVCAFHIKPYQINRKYNLSQCAWPLYYADVKRNVRKSVYRKYFTCQLSTFTDIPWTSSADIGRKKNRVCEFAPRRVYLSSFTRSTGRCRTYSKTWCERMTYSGSILNLSLSYK